MSQLLPPTPTLENCLFRGRWGRKEDEEDASCCASPWRLGRHLLRLFFIWKISQINSELIDSSLWFSLFREHPRGLPLLHPLPPSPALPQHRGLVLPNPQAFSPSMASCCWGLLTQWMGLSPRRCAHLCYTGGGGRGSSHNIPGLSSTRPPGPCPSPSRVKFSSRSVAQPLTYKTQSLSPDLLLCSRKEQIWLHTEPISFTLTLVFYCPCLKLRELPIAWNIWESPFSRLWPLRGHSIHVEQGSAPTGPWSTACWNWAAQKVLRARYQAKLHLYLHLLPIAHIPWSVKKWSSKKQVPGGKKVGDHWYRDKKLQNRESHLSCWRFIGTWWTDLQGQLQEQRIPAPRSLQ